MTWMLILLALVSGTLVPVQTGLNTQLARYLGHPVLSALASFLAGSLALILVSLLLGLRITLPPAQIGQIPGILWLGGLLGATYVLAMILLAPRLGAGTMISLVIAGQILASLVIDHFGLIGFPEQAVSPLRILGAILIIAGVCLIRLF